MGTCESCSEPNVAVCKCATCPSMICEFCSIGEDLQCKRCVQAGIKPEPLPRTSAGLCACRTCTDHRAALVADLREQRAVPS